MAATIKKIQLRFDDEAAWSLVNPVLSAAEFGVEADTGRFKIGNGNAAWNSLAYFIPGNGFSNAAILALIDSRLAGIMEMSPVFSVNGKTGTVVLTPADLGLGSVANTTDAQKKAQFGSGLSIFESNGAALTGGLTVGNTYRTADGTLKVVF